MNSVLIVGAGVCGLTLADSLQSSGYRVTILERESEVGGLSRTFRYGDFIFDIGPHRFFSENPEVTRIIDRSLGDAQHLIPRHSAVYYLKKYHTWPLRLKSVGLLPPGIALRACFDLLVKNYIYKDNTTFKGYVLRKYGKVLYETFFREYSEKFLGLDPAQTHWHWAKTGVERATISNQITTGSLLSLFKLMLLPEPKQLDFIYPPRGCDAFCRNLAKKVTKAGGEIHLASSPQKITRQDDKITEVEFSGGKIRPDLVVWSASLLDLAGLLELPEPGLAYLDLLLFNLELTEQPLQDFQWCYYGEKGLVFSRVTNPKFFSPQLIPQGRGGICVEVTCRRGDEKWEHPELLAPLIIEELVKVKTLKNAQTVKAVHIEKVRDAYPIYDLHYQEKLETLNAELANFSNLVTAGRTGLFWYNNMDHSIENALEMAESIKRRIPSAQRVKS